MNNKRVLYIVSRLPINTATGDRLRNYHFVKGLAGLGHTVDIIGFVPATGYSMETDIDHWCRRCLSIPKQGIEFDNPNKVKQLLSYFQSIRKGYPYRVWQWYDDAFIDQLHAMVRLHTYDVIHFSEANSTIALPALQQRAPASTIICDFVDAVSMAIKNSLHKNTPLLYALRWLEYHRLKRYEKRLYAKADRSVFISERDKAFVSATRAAVIPNGVRKPALKNRSRSIDILFVGNMAHEPNIDAVQWFHAEILPLIRAQKPEATVVIAGKAPSASIKALESPNFKITGFVDDIDAYYQRAKVFVCPMRLGAGQKNKVLEAMINKAAVVSTNEANIGINAPGNAIHCADEAQEFAQKTIALLDDAKQRSGLAQKGYQFVSQHFSWEQSVHKLHQLYMSNESDNQVANG